MYPLQLGPVFKTIVWGGTLLEQQYNKKIPSATTGESWEIAAHPNGSSTILNGDYAGRSLLELHEGMPTWLYGNHQRFERFPLLFKLIDANQDLSVQVHPDDAMAALLETGDIGKTEAWYVLHTTNPDGLVAGLKPGTTAELFQEAIENGTVESLLTRIKVQAGEVINIPAGIVHAINSGLLIAEIQQTSDTTFRVYDYNRMGLDGKPRELHVAEAMKAIKFDLNGTGDFLKKGEVRAYPGYEVKHFVRNDYFSLEEIALSESMTCPENDRIKLYFVLEGTVRVTGAHGNSGFEYGEASFQEGGISFGDGSISCRAGDSFLVPGSMKAYTLTNQGEATAKVLQMYVPN